MPTVATGSVIKCPNTGKVADVVITVTIEKARKLIGKPQKFPSFTAFIATQYREKSPKLSIGPEK